MRLVSLVIAALSSFALSVRADVMRGGGGAAAPAEPSGDLKLLRDVVYESVEGTDQRMDIAIPKGPGPFPLILCVHGGAWRMGDKSKFSATIEYFASHGYVAATMNYRLAPKFRFPSQLDDTRTALRFLKKHAAEYKVDVNRVGATGESAGAHLAMLMSFMPPDAADADPVTSTRLQAIVNYYGPVDLTQWDVAPLVQFLWKERFKESMEQAMLQFLGAKSKESPEVRKASPLEYVSHDCPPVLTFHGTLDPVVPFHHAELLHAALRKSGVAEKLVPIVNGLHGGWAPRAKQDADEQSVAFFDQILKGSPKHVVELPRTGNAAASGNGNAAAAPALR